MVLLGVAPFIVLSPWLLFCVFNPAFFHGSSMTSVEWDHHGRPPMHPEGWTKVTYVDHPSLAVRGPELFNLRRPRGLGFRWLQRDRGQKWARAHIWIIMAHWARVEAGYSLKVAELAEV